MSILNLYWFDAILCTYTVLSPVQRTDTILVAPLPKYKQVQDIIPDIRPTWKYLIDV